MHFSLPSRDYNAFLSSVQTSPFSSAVHFSLPSRRVPWASSAMQEASSNLNFSLPSRRVPWASARQEASSNLNFSPQSRRVPLVSSRKQVLQCISLFRPGEFLWHRPGRKQVLLCISLSRPGILKSSSTGTLNTPRTEQGFSSDPEDDRSSPTAGFSPVMEAVEAIRKGKLVVVVDDEDRENEGDLIMAASLVTPEDMAFMVKFCTGIICVGMKGEVLDRLKLPLMVRSEENEESMETAFTVSVDARSGVTTGVSASDRTKTVLALASPASKPQHFKRPGHIFPLRAREGGVLKRAGHTEAAVDLAIFAGLPPAGVLCEIVNQSDGSMSRLPELKEFAKAHNLPLISIADMIRFKRNKLVERTAVARLPTQWGAFQGYSYRSQLDGIEHIAMVKGDIGDGLDVLVRVHSECLTGDIFGSARCDCGSQLSQAMQNIEKEGRGVLVYLRGHEGRGIGLGHKLQAYNLQDAGRDTVEANVDLGLPVDSREYGIGAEMLKDLGVRTMKLMTNNPSKYFGLKGYGLSVSHRIPILSPLTRENTRYLETKRSKMGHIYGSDLAPPICTERVSSDNQTESTL